MRASDILRHSLRQVFGNLAAALRISGVLYAVQAVAGLVLGVNFLLDENAMQQAMATGEFPWAKIALLMLISLVISLWIVVAWHRYVLLNEASAGVPTFRGDQMLAYFGKSLLIGLVMIPIILVASIAIGLIMVPLSMVAGGTTPLLISMVAGVLVLMPMSVIATRLSLILPAAALGESMTLKQSWGATSGKTMTIAALMIVLFGASLLVDLPAQWLFGPASVVTMLWAFFTGWFKMMIGASVLTTLYGIYVEDRRLVFA